MAIVKRSILPVVMFGMALAGSTGRSEAGFIDYTYTTSLSLASGSDQDGLNGATVKVQAEFDTNARYVEYGFGLEVLAIDDATYTITGSSVAANNGTFSLPQLGFFPTLPYFPTSAGLFPAFGGNLAAALPNGDSFFLSLNTDTTTHGAAVQLGDTVSILDFSTVSEGLVWSINGGSGEANYNQINPTVSASLSNGAVPEPSSLTLVGLAGAIGTAATGWRRRKSAVHRRPMAP